MTKPLGVGIYSAAFKKDALTAADYAAMVSTMTTLNKIGAELAKNPAVHAMTDVTGFGILGHGLEMARGSGLKLALRNDSLPLLPRAAELAQAGFVTGASGRNWDSYGQEATLPAAFELWRRQLLTDPQTSGGLLVACAPDEAASILSEIQDAGYRSASIHRGDDGRVRGHGDLIRARRYSSVDLSGGGANFAIVAGPVHAQGGEHGRGQQNECSYGAREKRIVLELQDHVKEAEQYAKNAEHGQTAPC